MSKKYVNLWDNFYLCFDFGVNIVQFCAIKIRRCLRRESAVGKFFLLLKTPLADGMIEKTFLFKSMILEKVSIKILWDMNCIVLKTKNIRVEIMK